MATKPPTRWCPATFCAQPRDGAADQHADADDHEDDLRRFARKNTGRKKGRKRWGTITENLVMSQMSGFYSFLIVFIYLGPASESFEHVWAMFRGLWHIEMGGNCRDVWAQRISKTVGDPTSTTWAVADSASASAHFRGCRFHFQGPSSISSPSILICGFP